MPSALVLCFHRVVPDAVADDYWPWVERGSAVTVSGFESILDHLGKTHRWIDEREAADRLVRGRGSADRTCWITFDDGYRDNLDVAAPILKARGISPTLFISTRVLQAGFRLPVDRWYSALLSARASSSSPFASPEARMALLAGLTKQRFVRARKQEQDILLHVLMSEIGCSDSPDPRNERTIEYLRADDLDALCALGCPCSPGRRRPWPPRFGCGPRRHRSWACWTENSGNCSATWKHSFRLGPSARLPARAHSVLESGDRSPAGLQVQAASRWALSARTIAAAVGRRHQSSGLWIFEHRRRAPLVWPVRARP